MRIRGCIVVNRSVVTVTSVWLQNVFIATDASATVKPFVFDKVFDDGVGIIESRVGVAAKNHVDFGSLGGVGGVCIIVCIAYEDNLFILRLL